MEIEAKYISADPEQIARLLNTTILGDALLLPAPSQRVEDRYYDTPERDLWRAGYAFRTRKLNDVDLVTLKGRGYTEGPVHLREEYEFECPPDLSPCDWPHEQARELILRIAAEKPLIELLVIRQDRTLRFVQKEARIIAMLSIDEVEMETGDALIEGYTVEVELMEGGTPKDLQAMDEHLRGYGLLPETRSKFEIALALMEESSIADDDPGGGESSLVDEDLRGDEPLPVPPPKLDREMFSTAPPVPETFSPTFLIPEPFTPGLPLEVPASPVSLDLPSFSSPSVVRPPVTVQQLCARFGVDLAHARHVAAVALALFDYLSEAHGLPSRCRYLLEAAAMLHEIGYADDSENPHAAGRDLLLSDTLAGYSLLERDMLACIVRFNGEEVRPDEEPVFTALPETLRRETLALSALLRVGDALDVSRTQTSRILSAEMGSDAAYLIVDGPHADDETERARKEAQRWNDLFSHPLRVYSADRPIMHKAEAAAEGEAGPSAPDSPEVALPPEPAAAASQDSGAAMAEALPTETSGGKTLSDELDAESEEQRVEQAEGELEEHTDSSILESEAATDAQDILNVSVEAADEITDPVEEVSAETDVTPETEEIIGADADEDAIETDMVEDEEAAALDEERGDTRAEGAALEDLENDALDKDDWIDDISPPLPVEEEESDRVPADEEMDEPLTPSDEVDEPLTPSNEVDELLTPSDEGTEDEAPTHGDDTPSFAPLDEEAMAEILPTVMDVMFEIVPAEPETAGLLESDSPLEQVEIGQVEAEEADPAEGREAMEEAEAFVVVVVEQEISTAPSEAVTEAPAREPGERHPGISPDDPMAEAARKTLRFYYERLRANDMGMLEGEESDAFQEMHAATRRLRMALRLFGPCLPEKEARRLESGLKRAARLLGPVRDLDILLEKARHDAARHEQIDSQRIEPLLAAWEKRRQACHHEMAEFLLGRDFRELKENLERFLNLPDLDVKWEGSSLSPGAVRVRHAAPGILWEQYGRVRAYEPFLPDAPLEIFRALRTDSMRFRYALEFLREPLGGLVDPLADTLTRVQNHLNELHVADRVAHRLREFLADWWRRAVREDAPTGTAQAITEYLLLCEGELREKIEAFPPLYGDLTGAEFRRSLAEITAAF
ncbi:MAG: CHAD domain-containing protein [Armatimonadetes bacterium]|nr:CHAD domain-containing protein [Armatimonadota bacterium]